MQRIRQGDDVIVISGTHKGARGQVERVIYDRNRQVSHVVIPTVNNVTRHERPNPAKGEPGGRIAKEAPIHVSNVALYDDKRKRGARVRIETDAQGKRQRAFIGGERVG